ncbi:MAG: MBL fold metallo-hydrolase [Candidatus Krumholzibacteriia bacterium]
MLSCLLLGSGGAVPTPERMPAAYWVTVDGRTLLVDPGPGALTRLLHSPHGPSGVDDITGVLLSHLHLDHCADLGPLLFALHSPIPAGTDPLLIAGPPGLARYLTRLRDLYGDWLTPARRAVRVEELAPGDTLAPDATGQWRPAAADRPGAAVTAYRASHGESHFSAMNLCFRFRDAGGATLAYSGDGEDGDGLRAAARDADLLIVECSTPDAWYTPGHLTPSAVGQLCAGAGPRRVVLTHLYPPAASLDLPALVRATWPGPVETAHDGAFYTVDDRPGADPEPTAPAPR